MKSKTNKYSIGNKIEKARIELNMSRKQLVSLLRKTGYQTCERTIFNWERMFSPPADAIVPLVHVLNKPIMYFFSPSR